jgi:hypothetical protein
MTSTITPPTAKPNKIAVKIPAKTIAKSATKQVSTSATKPAIKPNPVVAAKKTVAPKETAALKPSIKAVVKAEKPKKIKLIRDSFTIPKNELNVLDDLKLRALSLKVAVKKSELLRAGIKALALMNDAAFLSAVKDVPALKTGRPKK